MTTIIIGDRAAPDALYDGSGGSLPVHKQQFYQRLRDKTLLDLGCGAGTAARFLVSKGNRVSGVTSSQAEADIAAQVMQQVVVADLDDAAVLQPFAEASFDAVLLGDVLEHLKYPHSLLKECARLLKPGGEIFVSVPNVANLVVRFDLLLGNFRYDNDGILDKTHLRFFTVASARELVERAGYIVDEVKYSNWNWSLLPLRLLRLLRLSRIEQGIRNGLTALSPGLFACQTMIIARRKQ